MDVFVKRERKKECCEDRAEERSDASGRENRDDLGMKNT